MKFGAAACYPQRGAVNVIQLTLVQLIAMIAGGPAAMILTVLVGILVNNSVNKTNIEGLKSDLQRVEGSLRSDLLRVEDSFRSDLQRIEGSLRSDLQRIEGSLRSDLQRVEDSLRSELQRVEGVLTAKLDALETRVKALEDQGRATLVKGLI
jgi:uncharacterized protein involved in exopolysaccharide biosynthesis